MTLNCSATFVLLSLLALRVTAAPTDYRFVKIADSRQFGSGEPYITHLYKPQLSSNGEVAFQVDDVGDYWIYKGRGGAVTQIVASADRFNFFGAHDINSSGIVAYKGVFNDSLQLPDGSSVRRAGYFTSNGLITNTIHLDTVGLYSGSAVVENGPVINDRGQGIAILNNAHGRQVIIDRQGRTIATAPNVSTLLLEPSLNNNGVAAFRAVSNEGAANERGVIRVGSKPTDLRTVLDTATSNFSRVNYPRLNDLEEVVFEASLDSGGKGIFVASGGTTRSVFVDADDAIGELRNPGINNRGQVAFLGYNPVFETGAIYTGPDLVADRVIAPGDRLLGLRVRSVYFDGEINNAGQIAFSAILGDGSEAIFRADPIVRTSAVPEPQHVSLVALAVMAMVMVRNIRVIGGDRMIVAKSLKRLDVDH